MSQDSSDRKQVNLPYRYNGDFNAIKQQMLQAVQKTMIEFETKSTFQGTAQQKQNFNKTLKNNMNRFVLDITNKLRLNIKIRSESQPEEKKVYLPPDINIEKNNQIREDLLKKGFQKIKKFKHEQLPIDMEIDQHPQLHVVYSNGYIQSLQEAKKNLMKRSAIFPQQIENLNYMRAIVEKSAVNLEKQLQIDSQEAFQTFRSR